MGGARPPLLPARRAVGWACALLLCSCSLLQKPESVPAPEPMPTDYELALGLLERDADVVAAERLLRQSASSCQNGEQGRRALLLLSSLWLDQHPLAHPDSAAVLAARVIGLPDADIFERTVARNVYLLALDLGADPALRPSRTAAPNTLALSFSDCEAPALQPIVALPELGREPLMSTVRRLRVERDSLTQHASAAAERTRTLEGRIQELDGELGRKQAELDRLRRLLGGRDTTNVSPRRR
jgi:hypothetical protein